MGGPTRSPTRALEVRVNGIIFVITMAIFVFGMWLMGNASHIDGFESIVFVAGILCVALALAIPTSFLGRGSRA